MKQIDELIAVLVARRADALVLHSYQPAQLDFGGVMASGAIVAPQLLRSMLNEIVPSAQRELLRSETAFDFSHACPDGLMMVKVERHGIDFHVVIEPYSSSSSRSAASSTAPPIAPTAPRVFVPPVEKKPTYQPYQPPVDQSLATPAYPIYTHTLPGYGSAPFVSGGGAPNAPAPNVATPNATAPNVATPNVTALSVMASNMTTPNFPAPLARAPVSKIKGQIATAKPTMDLGATFSATVLFMCALSLFVLAFGFAALWTLFGVAALVILMDSYLVGVEEGLIDGLGDCGPWTWFFVCLFFGFVGIPAYVVTRSIYKKALILNPPP